MTEEEYFIKHYPDSCYGDKPLSPYWDYFQDGVEFGERQSEKKDEKQLTKATEIIRTLLLVADNKVSQMEFQLCVADAKQFLKEIEK